MKFFVAACTMLATTFLYSQDCTGIFYGKVSDFHNGKPIDGATIYFPELNKYTITNEKGEFTQLNVCLGIIKVMISHIGCETIETEVLISTNDTFKEFNLEHHIEELGEVTIKATSSKPVSNSGQVTEIEKSVINQFSGASLGDALRQINGVNTINTGNSIVKPVINGMHSSRIIILNNNVRLQDQEWGIEHAPNLDLNLANNITVLKGSGSLAYGSDAIGGIVLVNPERTILKDTLYGNTILNGQSNGRGGNMTTSLKKNFESGWFIHGNGTLKKLGDYRAPDYYLTNTAHQTGAFSINSGYKSFKEGFNAFYSFIYNEIGILQASHVGNINDLANALETQQPLIADDFDYKIEAPKQEIRHHLVKLDYFKRFKSFGKLQFQYDYQNNQRFEFDRRIGDNRFRPSVDLNLQTHSFLIDLTLDTQADESFKSGILARYQDNFANPDTGVRRLIPDYERYDFGAFLIFEKSFNETFITDFGVRYDYNHIDALKFYRKTRWEEQGYDQDFSDIIIEDFGTQWLTNPKFTFHNIAASAGIRKTINNQELRLQYALTSRAPNSAELFSDGLHHSAARIEIGDLRLEQEWSNRIGFSYKLLKEIIKLNVEVFANHISNFIYIRPNADNPIQQSNRGAFPIWEYVQSDSFFTGLDITSNFILNEELSFYNQASFLYAQDLDDDIPVIDIPGFTNSASLNFSKSEWGKFKATLTNETVLMQNRFPDNNYTISNPTTGEDVFIDISTPPASYTLFHLNLSKEFAISNKTDLNVSLGIQNIFNITYRNYLNRQRFFADEIGRNFNLQIQFNY